MILAAGLGTRLRPLTDNIPKALVEVGGVPVLEHVARRLIAAGSERLIINVHHHADKVREFVRLREGFGIDVLISEELGQPLETGGGLKHAASQFRREAPFFMHNADILTDLDLHGLYAHHISSGALATLAVRSPETPRYLAFDEADNLCGYGNVEKDYEHLVRVPEGGLKRVDFCGVQVISPNLLDLITETGVFSIIKVYLRLAQQGMLIRPFHVNNVLWVDIGKPERLREARARFG